MEKLSASIDFRAIFKAINLPCLVLKPEEEETFVIVDANESYLKLTGTTEMDLKGKIAREAFPKNPDLKYNAPDLMLESFKKVVKELEKDQIEVLRYDIPNRETGEFLEKFWNVENIPVTNDSGKVEYILHTVQDITFRVLAEKKEKQVKEELLQNQQKYRHFVEGNSDGLYSLDLNGKFLNVNQGLANIAQVSVKKLLQMDFLPFCAEEDKDFIIKNFKVVIEEGVSNKFEAKFVSAKGRKMILEISLAPLIVGEEIVGVYGICKDLTHLRNSEEILGKKRRYLDANATFIKKLAEKQLDEDSLGESLSIIANAVAVDRIYYFKAHSRKGEEGIFFSQKKEWSSESVAPQIDNPDLQNIPASQLGVLRDSLLKNELFQAKMSNIPEGEFKDTLSGQDIRSLLILPIYVRERLYGFVGFDDCNIEREWNQEEISFLRSLADSLTANLEKQEAEAEVKKKEEDLKRSEQKFKALVNGGSDVICILDENGTKTFMSDSSTSVLGIKPEDHIGENILELIHPEDRDQVAKEFSSLRTSKQMKLSPVRLKDGQGNWRWVESVLTNMLKDPAVQGIVVNTKDVTQITQQAQEIKEINERYKLAATATEDLIYDWNLVTDEVKRFHSNQNNVLGHSLMKVNERSFWRNHIHPEELPELNMQLQEALNDKGRDHIHTEYRFRRADGSFAFFSDRGYIIRDDKGKAIRLVGASSDISELKAKEESLKIANQRFTLAMKATKEMIWDWDLSANKVNRSKAFSQLYGYEPKGDATSFDFWLSKIHEKDRERVKYSMRETLDNPRRKQWKEEYMLTKADSSIAHVTDRSYIIRDEAGKAIRVVGSTLDMTESKKALKRIEKQNRLLREIAWQQSHTVRAPLARIKALLQLLETTGFEEMKREDILRHLNASADELDGIVRNIVEKTQELEIYK